jgi:hypothetical protein
MRSFGFSAAASLARYFAWTRNTVWEAPSMWSASTFTSPAPPTRARFAMSSFPVKATEPYQKTNAWSSDGRPCRFCSCTISA